MELETLENNCSTNLERVLEKIVMKSLAKSLEKVLEKIEKNVEEKVVHNVKNNVTDKEQVIEDVNKNTSYIKDSDMKSESDKLLSFPKNNCSHVKNKEKVEKKTNFQIIKDHNNEKKNTSYINDVELNEKNTLVYFPENETYSTKFIKENWDISWNYDIYNNSPPIVINSDFVIKGRKCYFLVNNKNNPTYINLINPSFYPHEWNKKQIIIKNLHDQPIFSEHDYIQQLDSKEISNVILPSNSKGKYVSLMTNGKNWYIKSIF
jgi:hypothetical protein